ncbi:MAG TPA: IS1634 family transposase [Candidatus Lokiarchaeia archaeon]|nr:IS1634 family transposase [Candidatus Lokiarchaeia archaeon]
MSDLTYLTRKKKKGRNYLYLEGRAWFNGRSRRTWQKYLGPEDRVKDLDLSGILVKASAPVETEILEFGASAALWQVANEIDLVGIIDNVVGIARHQNLTLGQYLVIAAINRCVDPCSKSKLGLWFAQDWLSSQFSVDAKVLNAQTYWNHFQHLTFGAIEMDEKAAGGEEGTPESGASAVEQVELEVSKVVVERFGLDLSGVLYDSTNFFTFSQGGRGKDEGNGSTILRFGHSKECRNGNRLVAYWVLCTRGTGVPLMHETYPGNRQDAEVFKSVPPRVARRLEALGGNPSDITLVFDNGNLSPEGFEAVESTKFAFVAARRPSEHKKLLHVSTGEFTECTMPNGKKVQYYATTAKIYGAQRTTYVVLDPAAQKKRVAEFRLKLDRKILAANAYFQEEGRLDPATLAGKKGQGQKWLEKAEVEKKVAGLVGKAPFKGVIAFAVAGPAKLTLKSKKHFALSVSVDADAREKHEETLGKSVLFTNRDDWTPEEVIWAYREKYVVEHAFERMKCPSSISVSPMYHHADPCIRGHVFTCVLALLLQSLLRIKLSQKGINASYSNILRALSTVKITKIFPTSKAVPILKLNRVTDLASNISKVLNLRHLASL